MKLITIACGLQVIAGVAIACSFQGNDGCGYFGVIAAVLYACTWLYLLMVTGVFGIGDTSMGDVL